MSAPNPFEFDTDPPPVKPSPKPRTRPTVGEWWGRVAESWDRVPRRVRNGTLLAGGVGVVVTLTFALVVGVRWWNEFQLERDYWQIEKARMESVAVASAVAGVIREGEMSDEMRNDAFSKMAGVRDYTDYQEAKFVAKNNRDPKGVGLLFHEKYKINVFTVMSEGEESGKAARAKCQFRASATTNTRESIQTLADTAKTEIRTKPTYRRLAAKFGQ